MLLFFHVFVRIHLQKERKTTYTQQTNKHTHGRAYFFQQVYCIRARKRVMYINIIYSCTLNKTIVTQCIYHKEKKGNHHAHVNLRCDSRLEAFSRDKSVIERWRS